MPVRFRIPLPGPFVYVPRHRRRKPKSVRPADPTAIVLGIMLFVVLVIITIVSIY